MEKSEKYQYFWIVKKDLIKSYVFLWKLEKKSLLFDEYKKAPYMSYSDTLTSYHTCPEIWTIQLPRHF